MVVVAAAASNLLHTKNQNQINKPHLNYLTQMEKKTKQKCSYRVNYLNLWIFIFLYVSTKIKALICIKKAQKTHDDRNSGLSSPNEKKKEKKIA